MSKYQVKLHLAVVITGKVIFILAAIVQERIIKEFPLKTSTIMFAGANFAVIVAVA